MFTSDFLHITSHYGSKKCILATPRTVLQIFCNARYRAAMLDVMLAIFHDTLSPFYLCNCPVSGATQTGRKYYFRTVLGSSLTSRLKIVTTNVPAGRHSILNHLSELLELITKCSHVIFYWPLTNVHLLLTTIIDTIYLAKLFLIDNLSCFIV